MIFIELKKEKLLIILIFKPSSNLVNLNDIDKGINKFRLTKFDGGLIRGGVVGAA